MTTRFSLILVFLCVSIFSQAEPTNTAITLYSDGIPLAGNLWLPDDLEPKQQRPAILMVHGWGGLKSHLNQAYAPHFAAQGYVVLTFDYTGWGESEGMLLREGPRPESARGAENPQTYTTQVREIRRTVNPLEQQDDIRAAFAYLATTPQVDPDRIALWGSSLGGGLALAAAAEFPQTKVLMIQVGSVSPMSETQDNTADNPLSPANIALWRGAIARGDRPAFPSEPTPGLQGYPDWPDFLRYNPQEKLAQLQAATLIIDADQEELFDIANHGAALYERIRDRLPARYDTIKGRHYDVYTGDGYAKALALQKAWLAEHLPLD
ncbi:MAG: alpha/beta hydrolase [bacterium]